LVLAQTHRFLILFVHKVSEPIFNKSKITFIMFISCPSSIIANEALYEKCYTHTVYYYYYISNFMKSTESNGLTLAHSWLCRFFGPSAEPSSRAAPQDGPVLQLETLLRNTERVLNESHRGTQRVLLESYREGSARATQRNTERVLMGPHRGTERVLMGPHRGT